ncbi:MAG: HNH endonuclease [Anaerolineae bacterium]|jgi:uncharacterized protein (TIGR02646 family)|nr:HNH endonuclease [Anaerolineae bacterium]
MGYIPKSIRQHVLERSHGLCEYCQSAQKIIISLEVDHIIPISLDGKTQVDNLCSACQGCNKHKKDFTEGLDPQTQTMHRLFNPRQDDWHTHFQWHTTGTILIGLTAIGRATIERLQMNRQEMIDSREVWVSSGWHPPK